MRVQPDQLEVDAAVGAGSVPSPRSGGSRLPALKSPPAARNACPMWPMSRCAAGASGLKRQDDLSGSSRTITPYGFTMVR